MDLRIKEMSKKEKVTLLRGEDYWHTYSLPRLNLNSLVLSDGPCGIRKEVNKKIETSVCFPSGALLASTFNKETAYLYGKTLGLEAKAYGINILLGPAINIKRSPLG